MPRDEQPFVLLIGLFMLFVHAGIVYWSAMSNPVKAFVPAVKPCVVKTIALQQDQKVSRQQEKRKTVPLQQSKQDKKEVTVKRDQKVSRQQEKKAVSFKQETSKKKIEKKPLPAQKLVKSTDARNEKKRQLLAKAKKKLEEVQSHAAHDILGTVDTLHTVDTLAVDTIDTPGYQEALAYHLRQVLRLPELGDVEVQMTLDRGGQVVKVELIDTKSVLNSKYVEKTLPTIRFPPFGQYFHGENKHTFFVTLTNDYSP